MDSYIIKNVNINVPIKYFIDGTYEILIDQAQFQYEDKQNIDVNTDKIELSIDEDILKKKMNKSFKNIKKRFTLNKSKKKRCSS